MKACYAGISWISPLIRLAPVRLATTGAGASPLFRFLGRNFTCPKSPLKSGVIGQSHRRLRCFTGLGQARRG